MSLTDSLKKYLPTAQIIGQVAMNIAKVMPVSANVVNAIELGIKVANGIAAEVPTVIQTYEDIKSAAAGGKPVSNDEWAAWQAQVDEAHNAFLAAAARVEGRG